MQDLSYLTTEYARNKDIECYGIETKERENKSRGEAFVGSTSAEGSGDHQAAAGNK